MTPFSIGHKVNHTVPAIAKHLGIGTITREPRQGIVRVAWENGAESVDHTSQLDLLTPVLPPVGKPLAVLYRDNWDGEGDTCHLLASFDGTHWEEQESGKRLLEYKGDEILAWWSLEANIRTPGMPAPCMWGHDQDHDKWDSDCGESYTFITEGPVENGYRCCPGCGRPIAITPAVA